MSIFGIGATILGWVLPVVLGPLVYFAARWLLNAHIAIDNLPPIVKRFAVLALGTAVAAVFSALGVALPIECADVTQGISDACASAINAPSVVRGIVAGIVAIVIHAIKKSRPNA